MTTFVTLDKIAHAAGVSRRALQMAVGGIVDGSVDTWRGARLVVRIVKGRGGRSGQQYEVAVDSLPDALKTHFKDGSNALVPATAPQTPSAARRSILAAVLSSVLTHPRGSAARGDAMRALAGRELIDPVTLTLKRLSLRTIQRLVNAYERDGVAALGRRRRSDAGAARVYISGQWDSAVPFDDDEKARIAEQLRDYVRAQHKNHESTGNIAFKARRKLADLSRAAGFNAPDNVCGVPRSFIAAESVYRRVGQFKRDRKAFEDDRPGIRRTGTGMAPMQVIVGDVHHLDFVLPEVEGFQRYAKAICWLDVATYRIWFSVVVLRKGEGVRNENVIASFIEMALAWGLPKQLYLDNGSEYNWAAFIEDALKLGGGERVVIRAKPYGARSKPIEGIFGRLERHHFAKLPGWIGGDRMKSKTSNVGRAPTPFPGNFQLFGQAIDAAVALYHNIPQRGWLNGLSPIDAFNAAVSQGWAKTEVDRDAFSMVFSTQEFRRLEQGRIKVGGRLWRCDFLTGTLDGRVIVRIPKFTNWAQLPVSDERGRFLGFAHEDLPYGFLDPAGAREAARRGKIRLAAVRALDASASTIDPLAETLELAPKLPKELPAPVGARVTASDEQRRIAHGVNETPKQRRARERADNERETETQLQLSARVVAAMNKRPA